MSVGLTGVHLLYVSTDLDTNVCDMNKKSIEMMRVITMSGAHSKAVCKSH